MNRVCSIFSQILQLIPRPGFEARVREHKAERHARGFSNWAQLIAMLFCQLGHAQSLREITGGLAACEGKLRHLGVSEPPERSTLSYANEPRPWELYRSVFYDLLEHCQREAAGQRRKFRFKHKLLSIDASTIALSLSMFDWALYKRSKGAVKLHLVLDHDGYLPQFAVISHGKEADINAAKKMWFAPGTMLVFDRGYADYDWWWSLTQQKVFFVTRLKDNADYPVVEQRAVPERGHVLKDEVIFLYKLAAEGKECFLRRIEVWVEEKQETMVFVTNNLTLAASTIRGDLQGALADRVVLQGAEAVAEGQDLCGHQRERGPDPNPARHSPLSRRPICSRLRGASLTGWLPIVRRSWPSQRPPAALSCGTSAGAMWICSAGCWRSGGASSNRAIGRFR